MDYSPARLQLVKTIPTGKGWLYEPKFDGYRGLVAKQASGRVSVESRNAKDLGRWFPELVELARWLPAGTVIDGEIVSPAAAGVSFLGLQRRLMTPRNELHVIASETPVAVVGFDLLQDGSHDLRAMRLSERRRRLQRLVKTLRNPLLQLVTQTDDAGDASAWLDDSMSMGGIEGVVAKRDEAYPKPTVRRWQKIRRVSTMDVYVEGFVDEPPRLIIGLPHAGGIRIIGTTRPIAGEDARAMVGRKALAVPGEHRIWSPFDSDPVNEWFRIPHGLIAEVAFAGIDGGTLRQPAKFLRWRLT